MQKIENIKTWLNALESGEYKQTRGGWGDGTNSFCCLHVAYVLGEGQSLIEAMTPEGYKGGLCGATDYLGSDFLQKMVTIPSETYTLPIKVDAHLMRLNDNTTATFNDIASWVRETFGIQKE